MKLRNKKTGYVGDFEIKSIKDGGEFIRVMNINAPPSKIKIECGTLYYYHTLAELNDEWEDYKSIDPLIKDEKIRKAVRAWAEVNSIEKATYEESLARTSFDLTDMSDDNFIIKFVGWVPTLEDDEEYTIAELCGEEE